jgi:hypothetical protein
MAEKFGPFVLLEVDSIRMKTNGDTIQWYDIRGKDGKKWQLAATRLHAFVCFRNGTKVLVTADRLQCGDKIWVDQSAFRADGSLRNT